MSDSLIINARQHLRWHQRLLSDSSTAIMWGGWLYLWRPIITTVGALTTSVQPFVSKLMGGASPVSLELSVVALVGSSGTLLLWNHLLPARKAKAAQQANTLRDYANHFQLPEQKILEGRGAAICTVYHDANGQIVGLEANA